MPMEQPKMAEGPIQAAPGGDPFALPPGAGPQPPDMQQMVQQAVQQHMMSQGGGAGGAGGAAGGLKPKIDVNVEIAQIKNLLAKVIDHLGIPVPAQEMSITSQNLNQMAANPGATPGGGGGGGQQQAISPVDPMGGAAMGGGGGAPPGGMSMNKAAEMACLLRKRAYAIQALRERAAANAG